MKVYLSTDICKVVCNCIFEYVHGNVIVYMREYIVKEEKYSRPSVARKTMKGPV